MNKTIKIVIVAALIVAAGTVIVIKQRAKNTVKEPAARANPNQPSAEETTVKLPRLVDLGADKCVPCKMMKPILDELKQTHKEKFEVVFIDVWKNPDEAGKYGINVIPTQIFYDTSGNELFRHKGFYSKEDILSKWKELGFDF